MKDELLSRRQKLPFVCFACRLVTKHETPPYRQKLDLFGLGSQSPRVSFFCSRCGRPLKFLGRYFKAPPRRSEVQWRKVERLWLAGWSAEGDSDWGPFRSLSEAREFPERRWELYQQKRQARHSWESAQKWQHARRKKQK